HLPIAGGGYLRLFPVSLIHRAIQFVNSREKQPAIVYFHPWEIDPDQPRIKASLKSRSRHYLNISKTEGKVRYLLDNLQFAPVREILGIN
ncbi:DUF3473 domain-containing protein, partial [Candidatus Roizmanbacteria bacterium]|nr:DUF3473 domain-containing protein [Candidatus Roizmanbacteria bacterium]